MTDKYRLDQVSDGLFVDELQDAVYVSGIQIGEIADGCDVTEKSIEDWLLGKDLPEAETQLKILNWLETRHG